MTEEDEIELAYIPPRNIRRFKIMPEWQPIETAPKQGDFLVHLSDGHITAARLINGKYLACDGGGGKITDPTHWMPLPAPPESKEQS